MNVLFSHPATATRASRMVMMVCLFIFRFLFVTIFFIIYTTQMQKYDAVGR